MKRAAATQARNHCDATTSDRYQDINSQVSPNS
jgi:hypothetical protein